MEWLKQKLRNRSEVLEDPIKYRSLVGGLLYLAVMTRPDIAACTAILGRKFSEAREADWTAAKLVLRFLSGTKDYYLQLGGTPEEALLGHSDADWAGDPDSRRSTTGFVFSFGGGILSWASRRQSSVKLSSMEAEYVALSEASQETLWLRQLLSDFGETQKQPTVLREDNQGCLAFFQKERTSRRSKHTNTRERIVHELCAKKEIVLEYCSTDQMLADIFTKPLGPQKHDMFREMLGLKE
ncbi:uncharacterized protein LOC135701229 [Ochlerotatus camptorhynchus]|uniref:uncharacterized protein LOC135701229 n=1 Tax=Ochlerotatus camptorhynchus TaxID=644619 RepID=UPI0031E08DB7